MNLLAIGFCTYFLGLTGVLCLESLRDPTKITAFQRALVKIQEVSAYVFLVGFVTVIFGAV